MYPDKGAITATETSPQVYRGREIGAQDKADKADKGWILPNLDGLERKLDFILSVMRRHWRLLSPGMILSDLHF